MKNEKIIYGALDKYKNKTTIFVIGHSTPSAIGSYSRLAGGQAVRQNIRKFKKYKFSSDRTVGIFTNFNEGTVLSLHNQTNVCQSFFRQGAIVRHAVEA